MDQKKNRGFYDIIKTMYGGCKKIHDTESVGCINSVFKDHDTTIDEYDPAVDYHKIFDGIVKATQDMAEAEYAAGFDREGKNLNETWHGLILSARRQKLIPRKFN